MILNKAHVEPKAKPNQRKPAPDIELKKELFSLRSVILVLINGIKLHLAVTYTFVCRLGLDTNKRETVRYQYQYQPNDNIF